MSTYEGITPDDERVEIPTNLTHAFLLDAFRDFAFNNPAFRSGAIQFVSLSCETGDAHEESPYQENVTNTGYRFDAIRKLDVERSRRPELIYKLTVLALKDGIELPAHIALEQYGGMDATEAVEEAGLSTFEHETRYEISDSNPILTVNEEFLYRDRHSEIVSYAHTRAKEGPIEFIMVDKTERASDDDADDGITRYVGVIDNSDEVPYVPEAESLPAQAAAEIETSWQELIRAEASLGQLGSAEQEQDYLIEAFTAFEVFKRALRRQLGVSDL